MPHYTLTYKGEKRVDLSPLGVTAVHVQPLGSETQLKNVEESETEEGLCVQLHLEEDANPRRQWTIHVVLKEDQLSLRYEIPAQPNWRAALFTGEWTGIALPRDTEVEGEGISIIEMEPKRSSPVPIVYPDGAKAVVDGADNMLISPSTMVPGTLHCHPGNQQTITTLPYVVPWRTIHFI